METRTFRLTIAYRGSLYQGWQKQTCTNATIQEILENAIRKVTRAKKTIPHGSGRTDSGVHARGQVAHLKLATKLTTDQLQKAINANLPLDIRVLSVLEADPKFHAQRDVETKTYRYFILQSLKGHHTNWPFLAPYAWFITYPLNVKNMKTAAEKLVGVHDFRSFQNTGTNVPHTIREIISLEIIEHTRSKQTDLPWMPPPELSLRLLEVRITGTGFLKQMVRNVVGTLVDIGRGKTPQEEMAVILEKKSRKASGITAPAHGLFLDHVTYKSL